MIQMIISKMCSRGCWLSESFTSSRCFGITVCLGQHCFTQRIDEQLELSAGLTRSLRQCRAWDSQADTAEDLFLTIKRQVIGGLGHHHMRQQVSSGVT
jgi:hypothetical protein